MAQQFGRGGDQVVTQRDTWEAELLALGRSFVFVCPQVFLFVVGEQSMCFLVNGTTYGLLVDDIDFTVSGPSLAVGYKMILNPTFVDTALMTPGIPFACNRTKVQAAKIGPSFVSSGAPQAPPVGGTLVWNGNSQAGGGQDFVETPKVLLAAGDSILLTANTSGINGSAAAIKFHHV